MGVNSLEDARHSIVLYFVLATIRVSSPEGGGEGEEQKERGKGAGQGKSL